MVVMDIIKTLLQSGTEGEIYLTELRSKSHVSRGQPGLSWARCPAWPPDVFAVAATLVEKASCCMLAGPDAAALEQHRDYFRRIYAAAKVWTTAYAAPSDVQQLWTTLLTFGDVKLGDIKCRKEVRDLLFLLLAIADESCNGMGWAPLDTSDTDTPGTVNLLVNMVMTSLLDPHELLKQDGPVYVLPFVPTSLCSLIMTDVAVVLPKSMTASVGCTIRSMSHHLALLPSSLEVKPSWQLVDKSFGVARNGIDHDNAGGNGAASHKPAERDSKLRLLLVPYPFHLPETSFHLREDRVALNRHASTGAFFELRQLWLKKGQRKLNGPSVVAELFQPLLEQARTECGSDEIHGIVMPECALSRELANAVAAHLREENIDFFISGVLDHGAPNGHGGARLPHNQASTYLFPKVANGNMLGDGPLVMSSQSKHHRWSLDPVQVQRYALNFPDRSPASEALRARQWWEGIDIADRDLPFYAIRRGVSLAVLICEDLARTDPAMSVIRAVGPNLVIALLMDGPQLVTRWPARYATVLADDPGSSVLTLTCAALVDRSNWLESRPVRSIALWRDAGGRTQELNLPAGHHGMCLTLTAKNESQYTMDSRCDISSTQKLTLTSAIPLAIASPPNWL